MKAPGGKEQTDKSTRQNLGHTFLGALTVVPGSGGEPPIRTQKMKALITSAARGLLKSSKDEYRNVYDEKEQNWIESEAAKKEENVGKRRTLSFAAKPLTCGSKPYSEFRFCVIMAFVSCNEVYEGQRNRLTASEPMTRAHKALELMTYFGAFPFALSDLAAGFVTLAFFAGGASCNV